ncbi:MAG: hypothetical protein ABI718_00670 [Acidobacteriota bacterium]
MQDAVYWFPAWGWGLPVSWQGWVVYIGFFVFLAAGAVVLIPRHGELAFAGYAFVLAVLLVGICLVKGERMAWRWGKK